MTPQVTLTTSLTVKNLSGLTTIPITYSSSTSPVITVLETSFQTLSANTNLLQIPFPLNINPLQFYYIQSLSVPDLFAYSYYIGGSQVPIPAGCGSFFYNPTGLWLSSVAGGQISISFAA